MPGLGGDRNSKVPLYLHCSRFNLHSTLCGITFVNWFVTGLESEIFPLHRLRVSSFSMLSSLLESSVLSYAVFYHGAYFVGIAKI